MRLLLGCTVAVLLAGPVAAAETTQDLSRKQDQQRQVRAGTDHLVRRAATMLRVLDYYQLDKSAEKRLLDEVASTLSGLSREQMAEVIARLEKAKTADKARSRAEVDQAYQRHREILEQLRALLARYEAVHNLDQAAQRLDKAATDQLEIQLRSGQMVKDWRTSTDWPLRQSLTTEIKRQADEQHDLHQEVAQVLGRLDKLRDELPAEQKARLEQARQVARDQQVLANMHQAADELRREPTWNHAATLQRKSSADLQDIARALRSPGDRLTALREAREQVRRAIEQQDTLREQTQVQKDPRVQDRLRARNDVARRNQELGDRQSRLEHATRSVEHLLQPHAAATAAKLPPAERAMAQAEDALRQNQPAKASPPQQQADRALRDVARDLDQQIARAEKQQRDPLAALQKAKDSVEHLLKEQKDVQQKTQEANATAKPERLPPMADKQDDLARRTDDLNQEPLPTRPDTQAALDKAARAMEQAARSLDTKKGKEAAGEQQQAVQALERAKKQLGDQVAEIQKRREDIARLQDAARRLDQLARDEGKVRDQANDLTRPKAGQPQAPDAGELSKKQGELTPQAKQVGKQVEQAAPEGAKKVAEGAQHMEAAKGRLDKQQPAPASREAGEAAKKLNEAKDAVAKALDEKQGEELADRAAMQPGEVDPENAANQLAKAIEQGKQAAQQSEQAAARLGKKSGQKQPGEAELAKLQKQVADKAGTMKLERAARPADEAADALEKGDLPAAIEQQKKALDQLEKAAAKEAGEPPRPTGSHQNGPPKESGEHGEKKAGAQAGEHGEKKEGAHAANEREKGSHAGEDGDKKGGAHAGESGDKEGTHTAKQGEKEGGQHAGEHGGEGAPHPARARNARELAKAQKALLEATQAMAGSQEATQAATAALEQAQAQAPEEVQPLLEQANEHLGRANQHLHQGSPHPAHASQMQAVAEMSQAMKSLQSAMAAMARSGSKPGQHSQARGTKPGHKPGQGSKPGQEMAQGQGTGKTRSPSEHPARGEGNRVASGSSRQEQPPAQFKDVKGDGSFLMLPARQRDLIKQALSEKLPPDYAAMIQQYYLNLARGKPAAKPRPGEALTKPKKNEDGR